MQPMEMPSHADYTDELGGGRAKLFEELQRSYVSTDCHVLYATDVDLLKCPKAV